ncbi:Carboxysome shell and ethanolamine utilization microcompartment protein CcmL/EutN [Geosporobacter subterraneus DSM 17957]|uniref:Carboxysome shell and ethanolamine utilization microcompartment protein CcmL/EutN n=1 Tax=Geosporobacter subterraneus DSM 17957 TaxID=1121919 RepID=A0A1M6HUJ6_9FIRM|nr:BMC domain-containing protein [Geosporobacter subterraneus]SHJ25840.1 Carboxysome shell and ethanolamine utilization microcompartment protein CcmL/EutN [Geosporobacter subterraneus DSM 17957]
MSRLALGIIETVGLAAAIEAADAAVKSANVMLIGYELTKGGGMVTTKLEGEVGAVKAAVEAGCAAAERINRVWSKQVIPRPHEEIGKIIRTKETIGLVQKNKSEVVDVEGEEQTAGSTEMEAELEDKEDGLENPHPDEAPQKEDLEILVSAEVCNLCKDLKCPRRKGDLKTLCIHYDEKGEEE